MSTFQPSVSAARVSHAPKFSTLFEATLHARRVNLSRVFRDRPPYNVIVEDTGKTNKEHRL